MKTAKEWLMDPAVSIGDPEGHFADMAAELPESMSREQAAQWVRAIQADALEAAAKECEQIMGDLVSPSPWLTVVCERIRKLKPEGL